jgi:hypothetical protein
MFSVGIQGLEPPPSKFGVSDTTNYATALERK